MTLLWQGKGQDETLLIQTRNRATIALGSAFRHWTRTMPPTTSYSQAQQHCQTQGRRLCTRAEICPNGHAGGETPHGGKASGDSWVPVNDEDNQWVQTGDGTWPSCQLHTEISGGSKGKPNWGPAQGNHGFRHDVCCASKAAAAPAAAGAYGDPHCVNAAGDWFDIHKIGRVPMAILPRGALPEDADFAVVANTMSPDGWDKCAPSFINSVEVLLNKTGDKVVIKAGQGQALEVKESNKNTDAYRLEGGSDDVIMKKGPLALRVILNKVPTSDQSHFLYLDVEITGLKSLNAGGILGADSHDFAMDRPDGCDSTAMKKSKGVKASSAKAV